MTVEEREILLNLSDKGYSSRKVADKLKRDHSTVAKAIKRIRERQSLLNLFKSGENASQQKEMTVDYFESTTLIRKRQLKSSGKSGTLTHVLTQSEIGLKNRNKELLDH